MSEPFPESDPPRIDAWISAQDRMTATLNVQVEELSRDMKESFDLQTKYQINMEREIDSRFNKVDARFDKVEARLDGIDARFDKVEARLDKVETRLDDIEARMATKEDVAALEDRMVTQMANMEGRILDAFQQLVAMVIPLKQ